MQIEGSKIAAVALAKLAVAKRAADDVQPYSGSADDIKTVRIGIELAMELIALLAPPHASRGIEPATAPVPLHKADLDGLNDVSP